ncbi:MAG: hypothetical protein LQ350_000342 [Teloschistes chrysophthalmus]|nr:MAG: hypothetical protein LQ350_000342 [Niorma chrysophthalma]
MDVTRHTFHGLLPSLIAAIADAHFVAIDLELSGIPGQQINKPRVAGPRFEGKPSLQERYAEVKEAAEKYQVLQLGITCAGENRNRGVYVVRPYNLFLNPVPDERTNIERTISFQSGAVDFLLKHNFRMDGPFLEGVPYFSRAEEATARRLDAEQKKTQSMDIRIRDAEADIFMRRVRQEVTTWKHRLLPMPDFLNIAPVGHERHDFRGTGLNNYQKALVHQYVRSEHPDLTTISRPGFIQIVAANKEREDAEQKFRAQRFEERMAKQIGVRWLVEAIHGGDLSGIDAYGSVSAVGDKSDVVSSRLNNLRKQLMGQSTVLVGHNLFLDLIYFYACFLGPLPARVEDFQKVIHEIFPRIIDTKYLATHSLDNPALARSSLEELDAELSKQQQPAIELHPEHPKYAAAKPSHEAGYDSYLTARVLIRLASKLESSGMYISDDEESYHTPPEAQSSEDMNGGVLLVTDGSSPVLHSKGTSSTMSRQSSATSTSTSASKPTPFSHPTKFDLLGDISSDEDSVALSPKEQDRSSLVKQADPSKGNSYEIGGRMPAWDSGFWNVYGNKLRVVGTLEQMCPVGSWPH